MSRAVLHRSGSECIQLLKAHDIEGNKVERLLSPGGNLQEI